MDPMVRDRSDLHLGMDLYGNNRTFFYKDETTIYRLEWNVEMVESNLNANDNENENDNHNLNTDGTNKTDIISRVAVLLVSLLATVGK